MIGSRSAMRQVAGMAITRLVAHPSQLWLICRTKYKNDPKDAERLAKSLYLGEVPTMHVPSLDV
jgi:hypothetical protein